MLHGSDAELALLRRVIHDFRSPFNAGLDLVRIVSGQAAAGPLRGDLELACSSLEQARAVAEDLFVCLTCVGRSRAAPPRRAAAGLVLSALAREAGLWLAPKRQRLACIPAEGQALYLPGEPVHLQRVMLNLVRCLAWASEPEALLNACVKAPGEFVMLSVSTNAAVLGAQECARLDHVFRHPVPALLEGYAPHWLAAAAAALRTAELGGVLRAEEPVGGRFSLGVEFKKAPAEGPAAASCARAARGRSA